MAVGCALSGPRKNGRVPTLQPWLPRLQETLVPHAGAIPAWVPYVNAAPWLYKAWHDCPRLTNSWVKLVGWRVRKT